MRISTSSLYSAATSQLGTLQSQLARTQQQLSSNKRMLSAADDPIASARALEVTQSQSINAQFATNRQNARSALSQEEGALTSVQNLIQNAQTTVIAAGSGANSVSDRTTYANELQGQLDSLVALANTADGNGNYMFAGYKASTMPFVQNKVSGAIDYLGDQGQVQLSVGGSRKLAIGDSGSAVFNNIASGNGTFLPSGDPGNTGTGVISAGTVSDPGQLTGHTYRIDFDATGANYSVTDVTTSSLVPAPPPSAPVPYTAGAPIIIAGMRVDISGAPAAGDKFTLQPSEKQSLFSTLSKLIDTLRAPAGSDVQKKALTDGLAQANGNLSMALDNVLTTRSSVGSRMKELDTLDSAGEDTDIQYAATLSGLQDLDMLKAISQFTQQQTSLDAAQKSFKSMSSLSLFNYIG